MRALIQGMDERAAWERYLRAAGEPDDRRQASATINWIRDTFAAAARRERRPGTARLILLDVERVRARAAPVLPSLEEFALAQGLEDFSEAEQLEAYEAAYPVGVRAGQGGAGGAARRTRLVERQLEALRWLENLVVYDPRPLDAVEAWLNPALAQRLRRVGIHTLQELVAHMNAAGARWWVKVPGVGRHKAARVLEWLHAHGQPLRLSLGDHVARPRRQLDAGALAAVVPAATALRPLEKFVLPPALDGRDGSNRAAREHCRLGAADDRQAIEAWIAHRPPPAAQAQLTATQRSYRKEAERLLLWSVLERGKALSSLDEWDARDFERFLQAPPAAWCGPRYHQRWSPLWRPLEGGLSLAALRQSVVVLHGLFAYLIAQRYVRDNPFAELMRMRRVHQAK